MVERDSAVMKYFGTAAMYSHNRVSSNTSCVFFVLRFYRARLPPTLITLIERRGCETSPYLFSTISEYYCYV
jgi:hypothetical protein